MKDRINLQLFNEEVVIPPELEGVSKETAMEIMKEAEKQQPDNEPENQPAAVPETTPATEEQKPQENPPAEQNKGEQTNPPAEADSVNKQSGELQTGEHQQSIPYPRFKEVNEKNKAYETEIANMRAEMERLRTQRPVQTPVTQNAPITAPVAPNQQQQQSTALPRELITQLREDAFAGALSDCGMTQEDFQNLEYEENGAMKKLDFQTAYNIRLNQTMMQANAVVQQQRAQQQQAQTLQQQINQDYNAFADTMKATPNFDAAYDYACKTKFQTLPEYERQALDAAFGRAQSGNGSAQDIALVKSYFTSAVTEFTGKNATTATSSAPAPNKAQQAAETKLQNMQAHPRVDQVSGSNSGGNEPDIETLMRTTNWDDIPEDMRKKILEGRI